MIVVPEKVLIRTLQIKTRKVKFHNLFLKICPLQRILSTLAHVLGLLLKVIAIKKLQIHVLLIITQLHVP